MPDPDPERPPQRDGATPADLALAAEGGEIVPVELSKALDFTELKPVAAAPPAVPADRKPIEVRAADPKAAPTATTPQAPVPGVQPAPALTPEQQEHIRAIDSSVNYEVNVYRLCYHAVHEMVLMRVREEPMDSAELGEGIWGPGKRTPLEQAEPQVAIEVYRQVRETLREEEKAGHKADTRELISRVLGRLFGG